MRAVASLLLLAVVMWVVLWGREQGMDVAESLKAPTALMCGFIVLGAWLTGRVFDLVKLPKISGYLLFGLLAGPSFYELIAGDETGESVLPFLPREGVKDLVFVKDLAIALIAITAGGEIKFDWLKGQLGTVVVLTLAAVIGVGAVIGAILAGYQSVFGIIDVSQGGGMVTVVVGLALLSLIASGNSPAVAIAMISEVRADGPMSRTTLAVTVCKDLLVIVLFAVFIGVGKGVLDENTAVGGGFLFAVAVQLLGSIVLGAIVGVLMAILVGRMKEHLVFMVVVVCFMLALIGEVHFTLMGQEAHLKPLLLALSAGVAMRNWLPNESAPLFHLVEHKSLPVYCMFFAVAGAELDLSVFTNPTVVGSVVTVVLARVLVLWLVIGWVGKRLKLDESWRGKFWLCLTPQAGVTLALITILAGAFKGQHWAEMLVALLLGVVAIHALLGPVAYRWALVSSGEAWQVESESEDNSDVDVTHTPATEV